MSLGVPKRVVTRTLLIVHNLALDRYAHVVREEACVFDDEGPIWFCNIYRMYDAAGFEKKIYAE